MTVKLTELKVDKVSYSNKNCMFHLSLSKDDKHVATMQIKDLDLVSDIKGRLLHLVSITLNCAGVNKKLGEYNDNGRTD